MGTAEMYELIQGLGALSILLFIGAFLRAKVPLFQKLLLPASVIGGFIGLLLGPSVMGNYAILRFPEEWLTTWANLPGVLIIPIFAAVPLGMFMGKKSGTGPRKTGAKAIAICGLFAVVGTFQSVVGFGTNLAYSAVTGDELYRTFGYELTQGYSGGHGTAASVGPLLQSYGLEYWQTAQGVAITCATVGLLGGMLMGIFMINRANKRGETALGKRGEIPLPIRQGYDKDIAKQGSLGRETTTSSSVETVTVHLGLLLAACLMAFGLKSLFGYMGRIGEALDVVPVWFYALLCMYVVNFILIIFKLEWLVDTKVKARLTGTMTDFAVVSAIASLNLAAMAAYIVPLVIMCTLGFVCSYFIIFPINRRIFKGDYAFERGIMTWGVNTGVMITGMMLLKIVDPDYETPVLSDFSLGFSIQSLSAVIISPITYGLLATGSTLALFGWNSLLVLIYAVVAVVGILLMRTGKKSDTVNIS